jgi:hypothetical protein
MILLPAGMGSQLMRSEKPYPASPNIINDVVWMDLEIFISRDALKSDKSWATFELPDVGHMAMLDAPARVSELILQAA